MMKRTGVSSQRSLGKKKKHHLICDRRSAIRNPTSHDAKYLLVIYDYDCHGATHEVLLPKPPHCPDALLLVCKPSWR
jgi:hypothetical protein